MAAKKDFFAHESAFVEAGAVVGKGTKIWHNAQLRAGAIVGENCVVGKNAFIDFDVKIGNGVKVQNNSIVYNALVEDNVFIGPAVCFTNDLRPRAFIWDEKRKAACTIVKKGASVGANATLIAGITIGEFAMVGAGAVVTKNVPAHALVFGNPAKLAGFVCDCGTKLKLEAKENSFSCSACGKQILIPKEDIEKLKK